MCVNCNTCHTSVYRTSPNLCVYHSPAWHAGSARDTLVQSLAYRCTPRVYLLYSYCRLVCACTIVRVCSYMRVLVHCFVCCCTSLRVCAEDSTRENFNLLMSGTVYLQQIVMGCILAYPGIFLLNFYHVSAIVCLDNNSKVQYHLTTVSNAVIDGIACKILTSYLEIFIKIRVKHHTSLNLTTAFLKSFRCTDVKQ